MKTRALLIGAVAAAGLMGCSTPYYSTVRMQMPGNYTVTTVQKTESLEACRAASKTYMSSMQQGCPTCKVENFSCGALGEEEKPLWSDASLPQYSVKSTETRMLLNGPEQVVKPICDQLAREISAKGMAASCIAPGQARK